MGVDRAERRRHPGIAAAVRGSAECSRSRRPPRRQFSRHALWHRGRPAAGGGAHRGAVGAAVSPAIGHGTARTSGRVGVANMPADQSVFPRRGRRGGDGGHGEFHERARHLRGDGLGVHRRAGHAGIVRVPADEAVVAALWRFSVDGGGAGNDRRRRLGTGRAAPRSPAAAAVPVGPGRYLEFRVSGGTDGHAECVQQSAARSAARRLLGRILVGR
eukprot:ctg_1813.g495